WENNPYGQNQFEFHEIVSAGPDGKFGTDDDIKLSAVWNTNAWTWWQPGQDGQGQLLHLGDFGGDRALMFGMQRGAVLRETSVPLAAPAGPGGGGFGGGRPAPMAKDAAPLMKMEAKNGHAADAKGGGGGEGGAKPTRLREFFPETMLWNPSLIT